jgi:DNA helicase-2/ATP-dependent DNA helicase PcrA
MLGDISQSINPYMKIVDYANISHIFPPENTLLLHLNKSYRSTVEITHFARRILQTHLSEETVERHGDEPLLLAFSDDEALTDRIAKDIQEFAEKGYRSIGILTRTNVEANEAHRRLKEKAQVSAIVSGNQEYIRGAVVMPAYLAKGLEFDAVILYSAGNGNYSRDEERLLLYTACTRALHVLHIYHTGERSPLLPQTI